MEASHIKYSGVSGSEFLFRLEENMKVHSSIAVTFSANDALESKFRKVSANSPRVQVSALGVGEQAIFCLKTKRHVTGSMELLILYSIDR